MEKNKLFYIFETRTYSYRSTKLDLVYRANGFAVE